MNNLLPDFSLEFRLLSGVRYLWAKYQFGLSRVKFYLEFFPFFQDFDSQEPGVSSEKWIVFFNGALERSQFIEALAQAWKQIFEVCTVTTFNSCT